MARSRMPPIRLVPLFVASALLWPPAAPAGELHDAVRGGDTTQLAAALQRGLDVNARDEWGRTPLIVALQQDQTAAAELLIRRGADPSATDAWGRTALLVAAQLRNTVAIGSLLRAGADVNAANRNDITPLIAAAQTANRDAVALLLKAGAAADRQDNLGWTALMWAASRKDGAIVAALLEAGADAVRTAWDGERALEIARRSGADAALLAQLASRTPALPPRPATRAAAPPSKALATLAAPKVSVPADASRIVRGHPTAPVTIVEFTDFQCPYCSYGARVIDEVLARHEGQVRLVVRHLPLPRLHPMAMPAALRFEALALQDPAKAWAFYDRMLRDTRALAGGEAYLDRVAAEVGADMKRLDEDRRGDAVRQRVDADLKEAQRLRFDGVPVFVVNGHVIAGAQPAQTFSELIEALSR